MTPKIKTKLHLHNSNGIVIKYRWNIFRGESIRSVTNQEAGFANRSVSDDNAPINHHR